MRDPFDVIDELEIRILGLDLNVLRAAHEMRFGVFIVVLYTAARWQLGGFDSGILEYGTSLHWSFFFIYGLMFMALSYYYERELGLEGSRNVFYSSCFTVFAVAIFEWFWSITYGQFYGVWLIFTDRELFLKNSALTLIGLILVYHVSRETPWRLRLDRLSVASFLACYVITMLWIYCPWSIGNFPQTVYPQVDGSLVYIENNLVHAINVLAKIGWALAVMCPALLQKTRGCQ